MSHSVAASRLRPFAKFPAPDDIAALVAGWSARDQARFLIGLGFAIERSRTTYSDERSLEGGRAELIAHQIAAEEIGLTARYGTDLILAIAKVVGDAQKTEAIP